MYSQKIVLWKDRIGALIGKNGRNKDILEKRLEVKISINSRTGEVTVKCDDLEKSMRAINVIRAVNYGFSPERAFRLLDENQILNVIDINAFIGKSPKDLIRVKGRLIGERGKTRRLIEETTKVYLSVYSHFVAVIGSFENVLTATEAVKRLIKGAPHKSVYNPLFYERRIEKLKMAKLWE